MKKALTINNCFDSSFWYSNQINETFEVIREDVLTGFYVVEIGDGTGNHGSVNPNDCTVSEVEDTVVIRECCKVYSIQDYLVDLDYRLCLKEMGL